ncbi:hypothetical protein BN874_2140019 [Candidatus Contendobacter odensis Run_B_J11]|uniref:Uncharacterized protein n=1 Tax=Candidatus Contendobacter odensis Run_B_J11 TaxID=1400861 RepID=A0A7U7J2L7_9GAMM|nr:hypothetical protein BN874_2140019 [Candidatus Contendobacter odensis Run_B_J11]
MKGWADWLAAHPVVLTDAEAWIAYLRPGLSL